MGSMTKRKVPVLGRGLVLVVLLVVVDCWYVQPAQTDHQSGTWPGTTTDITGRRKSEVIHSTSRRESSRSQLFKTIYTNLVYKLIVKNKNLFSSTKHTLTVEILN